MNNIKVLHVIGQFGVGGDTTAVLNVLNYIKQNNLNYTFDFLTHTGANMEKVENIRKNGSKVFILKGDVSRIGPIKYYIEVKKILKSNQYDAIHFHTSFQSCVGMLVAKRCGIKKIVCHSHTSFVQRKVNKIVKFFAIPFCRFFVNRLPNVKIACSTEAKNNLFGKNNRDCKIIYNGLDIEKLKNTSAKKIEDIKKEYDLSGKTVIGQVGRISEMKNPLFTVQLAKRFMNMNYVFVIIGDGTKMPEVKEMIKEEGINNIILTGVVNDVNNYMSIFDYLLLPSKYGEGLPVVLVEEQIINKNCLCISADNVTREANLGNVIYLPISDTAIWEEQIKKEKITNSIEKEKEDIFNINKTSVTWLNVYEK